MHDAGLQRLEAKSSFEHWRTHSSTFVMSSNHVRPELLAHVRCRTRGAAWQHQLQQAKPERKVSSSPRPCTLQEQSTTNESQRISTTTKSPCGGPRAGCMLPVRRIRYGRRELGNYPSTSAADVSSTCSVQAAFSNHLGHLRGKTEGKLDDVIGHLAPIREAETLPCPIAVFVLCGT